MTVTELQELVAAWEAKESKDAQSEITLLATLSARTGELTRAIAGRLSNPANPEASHLVIAAELGATLWTLVALADKTGVDLTQALIDHLEIKR